MEYWIVIRDTNPRPPGMETHSCTEQQRIGNARENDNNSGAARKETHSSGKRHTHISIHIHTNTHKSPSTMKKEKVVAFLVLLSLPPAGALVVVNPGARQLRVRRAPKNSALNSSPSSSSSCSRRPTTTVSAGAAAAPRGGCGCSRLVPTGSIASRGQDLWRISTAAPAAARRSSRGSLRATVASWPAVEGTGSSSDDGRARSSSSRAAAADNGRVVLIEQEGPAWTEIVWDEVR